MAKKELYEQKTEALLLPMMEEHQFELVDVEFVKEAGTWFLRAYIDKPGGITIDDCEVISRALSDRMDEEDFMRGSEACIGSGWITSKDWVIDAEPTNGQIQMAHKGRTWYEIDVEGHTAHASTPWKGADAIAAMAEIISTLRQNILDAPSHPDMGISTVTFGQIIGGYRPYVVPDHCKLWIDMRLVPPLSTAKTTEFVQSAIRLAEEKVTGVKASYTITGDRPPIEMNPDSPLLAELKKACHHVTGLQPEVSCFTGYTDTAVIAGQLHNRNCMSYGPGCLEAAHQPDEWVVIDDILRCEKVYHQLIASNIL